jgi:NADPH-dependent glutamate synthase beta subunit-like oxidoreductase
MQTKIIEKNSGVLKDEITWVSVEANRCLNCYDPPCRQNCPADIPIPNFIRSILSGNIKYSAKLIRDANPMASICGAVCPEEVFCQSQCTRNKIDSPVNIRELHNYATKHETGISVGNNKIQNKVAIVGSGPAGLSCAVKLAKSGIKSLIYEKAEHAGGVPSNSIPLFRLSNDEINSDVNHAQKLGVEFVFNTMIDDSVKLLKNHDAVFIATGLPVNKKINIPGIDLPQITSALPFLEKTRAGKPPNIIGKKVVIIGGGNVSLDVAAAASEIGASEVNLLYRRGPEEMKVWRSELNEAQKRGVIIQFLVSPIEYIGSTGKLTAVKCARMRLTNQIDSSGRRIPEPVSHAEFEIPADIVIEAVGLSSDYGNDISINPDLTTSIDGVFAGGDWARGEGTIVEAVRDGKLAAGKIIAYLKEKNK